MQQTPTSTLDQWIDFGIADMDAGRFAASENWFRAVLRHDPNHFDGLQLLGLARVRQGDFSDGIRHMALALQLRPRAAHVLANLAGAQREAGLSTGEVQTLQQLCAVEPYALEPQLRLAQALARSGQYPAAFQLALHLFQAHPQSAQSAVLLADLLRSRGNMAQALLVYAKALELAPHDASLRFDVGDTFLVEGDSAAAAECFAQSLATAEPKLRLAATLGLLIARLDQADWAQWDSLVGSLDRPLRGDELGLNPFQALLVPTRPVQTAAMSQAGTRAFAGGPLLETAVDLPELPPRRDAAALKIAYLSPDLRDHPVGRIIAPVVEALRGSGHHVTCVPLNGSSDAVTERLRAASTDWFDASTADDGTVARYLHEREVDLVIDLAGPTAGARPGIFRFRPGRVRISWLGYPGSAGHPDIPYLLSDLWTLPDALTEHCAETLVRLKVPAMTMDGWVDVDRERARADLGLGADDLVIGSSARWRKINPTIFWHWIQALEQVPEAVLVLRRPPGDGEARLRAQLSGRRLRDDQIRFVDTAPGYDGYLGRLAAFDLALDTYPYGSHSMALEGLRVGTPLLAARGDLMQSRIGAAMLAQLGLEDLIVDGVEQYGSRLVELLRNPGQLKGLREELRLRLQVGSLLQPALFASHLDAAHRAVLAHAAEHSSVRIVDVEWP